MDAGQGVLITHVEGDAKLLSILFLTIVRDMLGEGVRVWLLPKVPNRPSPQPPLEDGLWPKLRDVVPTIPVNLGRGMRPILWQGDFEKSRLGCFRMKMAFAFVRPRLGPVTVMGDGFWVWLGAFNTQGKVMLGELVVSVLPITLQGSAIVFQFSILGTTVVLALCHFGDVGTKALYFDLEMRID
ncbi:unnamed protein product [Prunus armeniaca]